MNELKSEYMVLCEVCGTKMDNNFTQWRQRHPGATFDNYLQMVAIAENQIPPEPPKRKMDVFKSKSLKKNTLIVLITVLSASVGGWLGKEAVGAVKNSKKTTTQILDRQWMKKGYGEKNSLTLESPWELNPTSKISFPEEVKQIIEKIETFESPENKNEFLKVAVNILTYKPQAGVLNMQGAADGTMNGVKNQPGITNFLYDEQPYSVNSIPGFIQKGSYSANGFNYEFTSIGLIGELVYWQIMIILKKDDKTAQKAAQRIVKSISI